MLVLSSLPTNKPSSSLGNGVLTLSLKHFSTIVCVCVSIDIVCFIAIIRYLPDVYGLCGFLSPGCLTGSVKLIISPAFNSVYPCANILNHIFLNCANCDTILGSVRLDGVNS